MTDLDLETVQVIVEVYGEDYSYFCGPFTLAEATDWAKANVPIEHDINVARLMTPAELTQVLDWGML